MFRKEEDALSKEERKAAAAADKAQAREEREQQKAAAKTTAAEEAARAAFNASPPGRARLARDADQRFFQLTLPIENVDRTWMAKFSHEMNTRVKDTGDAVGATLTAVEDEGWELIEAGYVFRQTGSASRDKMLASGQQIAIQGNTLGVYLFRLKT